MAGTSEWVVVFDGVSYEVEKHLTMARDKRTLATSINTIKQKNSRSTPLQKHNARQRASSDGHSSFQTTYDIRRTLPKLHVFAP
ncbi:hypothetical protein CDAR_379911 [Caerostris darwini]|uniref:Uncharacterized protein n=1 Tax=Caerostris darwini TaxID=1538125 RepID=A0AAV4UL94_9ARAC|nr:hypothetical protein CDAR_379911 [Caerostris darwini]